MLWIIYILGFNKTRFNEKLLGYFLISNNIVLFSNVFKLIICIHLIRNQLKCNKNICNCSI